MLQAAQRQLRTPVGVLCVTASERGVTAVERVSRASVASRAKVSGRAQVSPRAARHADTAVRQLREYFAGTRRTFTVSLDLDGTEFQQQAWAAMCSIRYGHTLSYAQQAKAIGKPKAVRAVGSANGANPVPIIVPCHRVIASDGSLGGYALGLAMKRYLLALETTAR
jgi:methylated-DNA-[protein]-cysteine S-methyltransferase